MRSKFIEIVQGFKNIIHFWKVIWNYRWWDYIYTLEVVQECLKTMPDNYRKYGVEVEDTLNLRIEKMEEAVEILDRIIKDEYSNGYIEGKITLDEIHKKEETDWNRFFEILKGSDKEEGTDLRGWWD